MLPAGGMIQETGSLPLPHYKIKCVGASDSWKAAGRKFDNRRMS